MDIRESLEQGHSKALTLRIIAYIGNDADRLAELMKCFFDKEWRICQQAAWAVGLIGEKQPVVNRKFVRHPINLNLGKVNTNFAKNTEGSFFQLSTIIYQLTC